MNVHNMATWPTSRVCRAPTSYAASRRTANAYVYFLTQHKRLRENSWKLPPMSYLHAFDPPRSRSQGNVDVPTATLAPSAPVDAVALEFDQHWETTSDLNEDDLDYMREETVHWWGNGAETSSTATSPGTQTKTMTPTS